MEGGLGHIEEIARHLDAIGADFELLGNSIGVLTVRPEEKEQWNSDENMEKISKHFWPVIGQNRPATDEKRIEWLRDVYQDARSVYVIFGREGPIGTACLRTHQNDPAVQIIHDITLNNGTRKSGLGKRLFESLINGAPEHTKGFVGIASNPLAINAYAAIAASKGMVFSWGRIQEGEEELFKRGYEYVDAAGYAVPMNASDRDGLVLVRKGVLSVMTARDSSIAKKYPRMQQFAATLNSIRMTQRMHEAKGTEPEVVVGGIFAMHPNKEPSSPSRP